MDRAQLPLNALRAFEAAARHLSFTRAALELHVSQGAVSHQVAGLESRLGVSLFRRLPRGLALTDEGQALLPVITQSFDGMGWMLDRFTGGPAREVLTLGVVGTFANGWLIERLPGFAAHSPHVDLRIMTNNNHVDLAGDGLDFAIRFGVGAWHGTHAEPLMAAPLAPLCAPDVAERLAETPARLSGEILLRSYRAEEWARWFSAALTPCPMLRGPIFDSSVGMVAAAQAGHGVALAPVAMFTRPVRSGALAQPFPITIDAGRYWLTRLHSRMETGAMHAFRAWLLSEITSPA